MYLLYNLCHSFQHLPTAIAQARRSDPYDGFDMDRESVVGNAFLGHSTGRSGDGLERPWKKDRNCGVEVHMNSWEYHEGRDVYCSVYDTYRSANARSTNREKAPKCPISDSEFTGRLFMNLTSAPLRHDTMDVSEILAEHAAKQWVDCITSFYQVLTRKQPSNHSRQGNTSRSRCWVPHSDRPEPYR